MMCEHALELMLEAEPAELEGRADSPLAAHIAGCERCAAVAATLASELASLDAGLDAAWTDDADAAADRALAEIRAGAAHPGAAPTSEPVATNVAGARAAARWVRWTWVPLAAAAVLTAVFIGVQPDFPASDPDAVAETETTETRMAVTTPADRNAAIMKTANPNITVVWLY